VIKVRNGDIEQEIDARPSDALALAVQLGCSIYIAEEVMQQAGLVVPEGRVLRSSTSDDEKNREFVIAKIDEILATRTHPTLPKTAEERAESAHKFMEFITEESVTP
jgi:bifunctional DNase/RNase